MNIITNLKKRRNVHFLVILINYHKKDREKYKRCMMKWLLMVLIKILTINLVLLNNKKIQTVKYYIYIWISIDNNNKYNKPSKRLMGCPFFNKELSDP